MEYIANLAMFTMAKSVAIRHIQYLLSYFLSFKKNKKKRGQKI